MKTKDAMDHLISEMSRDSGYAYSWHANIAMCAVDEGVDHETAQDIASRFMKLAFNADTSHKMLED